MSVRCGAVARRAGVLLATLACATALVYVERAPERPLAQQPGPDADEYADSARSLAHDKGFYTYLYKGSRQPPRYPPGYPMALAPFAAIGSYPRDVQRGAKFWAILYVLVAIVAAWVLGGPAAGVLTALFVSVSPFARDAAGLVMSDVFVAGMTIMILPLLGRPATRTGARLAGLATGLATLARLTAGINLIALLAAWPRRFYKPVLLFALPLLIGLALLQWAMFGSPLKTGYSYWGVSGHFFSLSYATSDSVVREGPWIFPDRLNGELLNWVCPCQLGGPQASLPNLTFYPLLLAGLFWVFSPPVVPLLGLVYAWRRRREPVGRYALVVTALSLLVFEFYFYQGTRFMAGPAAVLTVLASVWLAELGGRVWRGRARNSSASAQRWRRSSGPGTITMPPS
jgi:4-amino-4-deoxy-L-arabinose transferase-like glycosyltransferase